MEIFDVFTGHPSVFWLRLTSWQPEMEISTTASVEAVPVRTEQVETVSFRGSEN